MHILPDACLCVLLLFDSSFIFLKMGKLLKNAASPILFSSSVQAYSRIHWQKYHEYKQVSILVHRQLTLCSWLTTCTCKFQIYAWKQFIHGHKHSPCKLVRAATHTCMFYRGKLKIFFRWWLRTTATLPPGKTIALNPPHIHHLNFRSHLLAKFGVRPCR